MAPLKLLMMSTSFFSTNGYSAIGHSLITHLAKKQDLQITHWAFQNFPGNPKHAEARKYPSNVQVYDAFANEQKDKGLMGFGFDEVTNFVNMNKPDVIWIYNDMVVVSNILEKLKQCEHKAFKTIVYMDQVYLTQRKEFIKRLNEEADFVILFTPFWEECVKEQGLIKPTAYLQHGFDPMRNYPVPKNLARLHFGLKPDDFIVINTCRNVPRKRIDLMMIAWAKFVSRHLDEPVKLLLAMNPTQGAWNLIEIYEYELKKYSMTLEEGMKHIILIDNPQQLTDEDLNTLYNTADIGINTCQGAGFELTTFEHGGMGIPQIATLTGGIRDFLDNDSGMPVTPVIEAYTEQTSDGCYGRYELCHPDDFAAALEQYYADDDLRKEHGKNARTKMLTKYRWEDISDKLYKIFLKVADRTENTIDSNNISLDDINNLENNLNINCLVDAPVEAVAEPVVPVSVDVTPVAVPSEATPVKLTPQAFQQKKKNDIKSKLQAKLAAKKQNRTKIPVVEESDSDDDIPIEKLLKMKNKIDKLLSKQ